MLPVALIAVLFFQTFGSKAGQAPAVTQGPNIVVQGPDPAVIRLGDTAIVTIDVEGNVDCEVKTPDPVDGLDLRIGPRQLQQFSSFDGKRMRTRSNATFSVQLRPKREGTFEIPFLPVRVGTDVLKTRPLRIEAVRDITGSHYAFMEVEVPKKIFYVGEPIRMKIRIGLDTSIRRNLLQLFSTHLDLPVQIEAPWLSDFPGGVEMEKVKSAPGEKIVTMAANQTISGVREAGSTTRDNRTFIVYEMERAWIPGRFGGTNLQGAMLRFTFATRITQNLLGENIAQDRQNAFVYTEPVKLDIRPVPEDGRPKGYGGAVGQFKVSADASPRELKVGESLKFKFRIEGQGNLPFFDPPKLEPLDGFHVYGRIDDKNTDSRVITYDLSPLSESVTQIPGVAFSYFDTAEPAGFRAMQTEPIAITVRPLPPGSGLAPLADDASKRVIPGVDDIYDIQRPGTLPSPPPGPLTAALALGTPLLLTGAAFIYLRRREHDLLNPALVRARAARGRFEQSVRSGNDSTSAFVTYLADHLDCTEAAVISPDLAGRLRSRGIQAELADAAARYVLQSLEARYAGGGAATGGAPHDAPHRLVDRLEPEFQQAATQRQSSRS